MYDYGSGRLRLRGDYEAVLGRERRPYDLNQGNYAFEISGTKRFTRAEVAVLSQHVSRHLVDRDNPPSISWNTVGVRVQGVWTPDTGLTATRRRRRSASVRTVSRARSRSRAPCSRPTWTTPGSAVGGCRGAGR